MRFEKGWVKNHRLRYDHWLENDLLARSVLDTLVRWANYEDSPTNAKIILKRGQCVTSSIELAKGFDVSRKRIRNVLEALQKHTIISIIVGNARGTTTARAGNEKGHPKGQFGSMVTILNYDKYQSNEKDGASPKANEGPAKGQLRANEGPLTKELKNNKKERIKELIQVTGDSSSPPATVIKLPNPISGFVWESYKTAYERLYKVAPVRNAKINGQITSLVKRLGEDAPKVAEYFLAHRGQFYVSRMHPIGLLLNDAEKLHTEWKLGIQMTKGIADQSDRAATVDQVFEKFINDNKERGRNANAI